MRLLARLHLVLLASAFESLSGLLRALVGTLVAVVAAVEKRVVRELVWNHLSWSRDGPSTYCCEVVRHCCCVGMGTVVRGDGPR